MRRAAMASRSLRSLALLSCGFRDGEVRLKRCTSAFMPWRLPEEGVNSGDAAAELEPGAMKGE